MTSQDVAGLVNGPPVQDVPIMESNSGSTTEDVVQTQQSQPNTNQSIVHQAQQDQGNEVSIQNAQWQQQHLQHSHHPQAAMVSNENHRQTSVSSAINRSDGAMQISDIAATLWNQHKQSIQAQISSVSAIQEMHNPMAPIMQSSEHTDERNAKTIVAKRIFMEYVTTVKQEVIAIRDTLESIIVPHNDRTASNIPLSVQMFTQRYNDLLHAYRETSDTSSLGDASVIQSAKFVETELRSLVTFIISAIEILEQLTIHFNDSNINMAADDLSGIRSQLLTLFQKITNISAKWYKAKAKTKMLLSQGIIENKHDRATYLSKSNETNGHQILQSSSGRKRKLSTKLADSVGDESLTIQEKKTASRSTSCKKSIQKKKIKLKKKSSSLSVMLDKAVSEDLPKESDRVTVTILDSNPDRIVNPLIEVPQGSTTGEPNLLVSEFVRLLPIFFPEPDTFPLSYYAKLLGFSLREDISLEEQKGKWQIEDELRKSDAWFNIPPLGKFGRISKDTNFNPTLNYVDKMGERCEKHLDYVDPVWLELLNDHTSYRDGLTKAAVEMKECRVISKDCVSLAKSLGLVDGNITFRIGGVEDAVTLSSFSQEMNEAYWLQKLKMSHHVIILAYYENSNDIIGFIHFHFCWYPLKALSMISAEDAALERMIKIDTLHVKDKGSDRDEKLSMVLFGLALEDARRHAAWGIIDIHSSFSSLLEKYYRMSVVGKGSSDDKTLLVCDFENSSYRFAFHTEFERDRRYESFGQFRLLVQLPLKTHMTSNMNKVESDQMQVMPDPVLQNKTDLQSSVSQNSVKPAIEHKKIPIESAAYDPKDSSQLKKMDSVPMIPSNESTSSGLQDTVIYSSDQQNHKANDDDDRMKNQSSVKSVTDISRTVPKNPQSSNNIAKPFLLNFPKTVQNSSVRKEKIVRVHVEGGSVSKTQHSEMNALNCKPNCNEWNILKLFPYSSTESQPNGEKDYVLMSLKKHQDDLKHLEDALIPRSQALMSQAYEERLSFEHGVKERVKSEKETIAAYENLLQKKLDAQKAFEMQQQEDDNAVCDICYDGESSGENRIIFCDSCDLSVHQQCYRIDVVPKGDYFCRACLFFKRDTKESSNDTAVEKDQFSPPIVCELCPKKGGAFVQTFSEGSDDKSSEAKWVHVLCAKWQGLLYLDDTHQTAGMVENVTGLKKYFRDIDAYCYLCKGMRGAYHQCREEGCKRWMHVTCARSSGICNVYHGEDHLGKIDSQPRWELACPDHSSFDADYSPLNKVELEDLVALAKTFPAEPKAFNKMNAKERKERLSDPKVEWDLIQTLSVLKDGLRCEICDDILEGDYTTCSSCDSTVHEYCALKKWETYVDGNLLCLSCGSKHDKEDDSPNKLECNMCNKRDGTLVECFAVPMTMKKWKANKSAFKRSMFGRRIWCHPVCGLAHPYTRFVPERQKFDCSNIIMSDGASHIESRQHCVLCGRSDKIKVLCSYEPKKNTPCCKHRFHATCARQAGLQVNVQNDCIMCFMHMDNNFNLRAFMEDMIEPEKKRSGNDLKRSSSPMSLECAASIFNNGIRVLNCLGWAWQWAKWWVAYGDSWEPLLEEGQIESKMTKEELRIVESTPLSRRLDARRCRLVAFSAALRNRDYDKIDGDDRVSLSNALQAIMNTPSLVGPLSAKEKDFFVEWLGRVYRSKSHLLGFGDNKIPVAEPWSEDSLVHYRDKTAKFELGERSLPGSLNLNHDSIEIDDFFENESEISPLGAFQEKSTPKRKKRGNPPKTKMSSGDSSTVSVQNSSSSPERVEITSKAIPSPKKGHNPKKKDDSHCDVKKPDSSTQIAKRKRGRPPRKKIDKLVSADDDGEMPPPSKDTLSLPIVKRARLAEKVSGQDHGNTNDNVETQSNAESNVKPESIAINDDQNDSK